MPLKWPQDKRGGIMKYTELNDTLMHKFPELKERWENDFAYWKNDKPPEHVFYGMVLNGFVADLLVENSDLGMLKKVFAFYEAMAHSDDPDVVNVLQVTLLEYLWDDKTVYDNAKQYMLPKTLLINENIKEYLYEPTR
jgi:hypothetical protein